MCNRNSVTIDTIDILYTEKPPRNSDGFCGGGQGLSWAVEPKREREMFNIA
jgi:hypothetical protein